MTLFVVVYWDYEPVYKGIFSSKEKADKFMLKYNLIGYSILEVDLDTAYECHYKNGSTNSSWVTEMGSSEGNESFPVNKILIE